jgi:hypothetical protein
MLDINTFNEQLSVALADSVVEAQPAPIESAKLSDSDAHMLNTEGFIWAKATMPDGSNRSLHVLPVGNGLWTATATGWCQEYWRRADRVELSNGTVIKDRHAPQPIKPLTFPPRRAAEAGELREGMVVEIWAANDVEAVKGYTVEVVTNNKGETPANRITGCVSGWGRHTNIVELDNAHALGLPVHVRIEALPVQLKVSTTVPKTDGQVQAVVEVTGLSPERAINVAGGTAAAALGFSNNGEVWKQTESQVMVKGCEHCRYTGVLRGLSEALDKPCPCSPVKDQGPSEWTEVNRQELTKPEHLGRSMLVTFQKNEQQVTARVSVVVFEGHGHRRSYSTRAQWVGDIADVVYVRGEASPEMAIARLLCGLRDGTVKP